MTLRDFVCIAFGEILLAGTFALGVLVGVSMMKRKDSPNGYEDEGSKWHHVPGQRTEGGSGCRQGRCANKHPKADSAERPNR
jgi:hypothetical protein